MYVEPRPDVLFGDIFEAPYLFDVHLQADAARLTTAEFPNRAPLVGTFYTEPQEKLALTGEVVRAYGRSGQEREGREHRDTHGLPGRAILLSDDCHIPTAYGDRPDRHEARGRLLFAILRLADEDTIREVAAGTSFARFALSGEEPLGQAAIADLGRVFLVHAKAVDPAHRVASLDDDGRLALEKRWSALTCRRGPEASRENAGKLGELLADGPELTCEQREAVTALWQVLDLSWDLEGRVMRSASVAFEQGGDCAPVLGEVIDGLRGLSALANAAADQLEACRPRPR